MIFSEGGKMGQGTNSPPHNVHHKFLLVTMGAEQGPSSAPAEILSIATNYCLWNPPSNLTNYQVSNTLGC